MMEGRQLGHPKKKEMEPQTQQERRPEHRVLIARLDKQTAGRGRKGDGRETGRQRETQSAGQAKVLWLGTSRQPRSTDSCTSPGGGREQALPPARVTQGSSGMWLGSLVYSGARRCHFLAGPSPAFELTVPALLSPLSVTLAQPPHLLACPSPGL